MSLGHCSASFFLLSPAPLDRHQLINPLFQNLILSGVSTTCLLLVSCVHGFYFCIVDSSGRIGINGGEHFAKMVNLVGCNHICPHELKQYKLREIDSPEMNVPHNKYSVINNLYAILNVMSMPNVWGGAAPFALSGRNSRPQRLSSIFKFCSN
jgi:hypothetical protein